MTTSFEAIFSPGSTISGRRNKNCYRVERLLGEGANGKVFLVRNGREAYALKVGFDPVDLQLEVNTLRAMEQSGGLHPYLVEADDFSLSGKNYPFYVMKYVRGMNASQFIKNCGADWIFPVGLNVLKKLCALHERGWIFGDLKTENVIVSDYGQVELIDFGGVTAIGRSVRQFTEIYDRGFWSAGTRVADSGYDLFAFAVFCLKLADTRHRLESAGQLHPHNRNTSFLLQLIAQSSLLKPISSFLRKAILGQYATSAEAYRDWKMCAWKTGGKLPVRTERWIHAAFLLSVVLFGCSLYVLFTP